MYSETHNGYAMTENSYFFCCQINIFLGSSDAPGCEHVHLCRVVKVCCSDHTVREYILRGSRAQVFGGQVWDDVIRICRVVVFRLIDIDTRWFTVPSFQFFRIAKAKSKISFLLSVTHVNLLVVKMLLVAHHRVDDPNRAYIIAGGRWYCLLRRAI